MVEKIAVIGAGTMGAGIAQVALEAGYQVALVDTEQEFVDRGTGSIKKFLERKVAKGTYSRELYNEMEQRLSGMTDMSKAVGGAVMVVEAVFENLELKQKIFRNLSSLTSNATILASNTSTLSISAIAEAADNPSRVIGTHYFSPVPLMRLVEVIRGENTSDDTVNVTVNICKKFGKTPIIVKDIPGFIVNRFLCLMYNEAANMVDQGLAKPEDIDTALKLGCNWPMGVMEIMDMAGVDVCAFAMEAMYQMTGEERYKPSPLFEKMLAEKKLGRKTGEGFYSYTAK
ncbi:MAG: 3-hydroxyacyl-CoA dehydrogenase family protein [Syntrophales bacterium]|nr:3-hydroxyacyl-CoA dehydrogenase family protein [Syntrophales bacterium]MDX9922880.1 3-hydroxyacyl-CoA dehydrogenase family protein [Syntrophales bacterium]